LSPGFSAIVDGDANKLSQVLRNLISNAVKFTPCKGMVSVSTQIINSKIIVKVQDSGAGMDRNDRLRLFNEIVQFNASTLQKGNGSGLGLYLTRRIVDLHGGRIWVDLDWEGPGSIFLLELDIVKKIGTHSSRSLKGNL
jgi:signal transduction histidine kinase